MHKDNIIVIGGGSGAGKLYSSLKALAGLSTISQVTLHEAATRWAKQMDDQAIATLLKSTPMIDNPHLNLEKCKLSDKFPQPFERTSLVKDQVSIFNGRRQKKNTKKRKKK